MRLVDRGQGAEGGEALQDRLGDGVAGIAALVQEVVVEPERVEGAGVGDRREPREEVPGVAGRAGVIRIDLQPELHGDISSVSGAIGGNSAKARRQRFDRSGSVASLQALAH